MSVIGDQDTFLEACRATFAGRPETHRIALYARVADRERDTPIHLYRLANACLDGGSVPLWTRGIWLAFELPHDSQRARFERREARIRLGDWGGWQDLACWENDPDFGKGNVTCPPEGYTWWDGREDLSGKSLRVTLTGGYGDSIMWMRFVESLRQRVAGQIYWDTFPVLTDFMHYNIGHLEHVELVDGWTADGCFDRYLSATSLPTVIGAFPEFKPWSAPPATEPSSRGDRARIGIAWASSLNPPDHLERTVPLSILAPFFWRDDIEVHSLQVGERMTDGYYYPNVRTPDPPLRSFSDTARWMATMDGVIAVDTAVAHLAGLLGVPTLLLLRFACDRRWGLAERTPWYPSVRLIRQSAPGDWLSIRPQIQEALDARWWVTA
jgi:hypothetical protein